MDRSLRRLSVMHFGSEEMLRERARTVLTDTHVVNILMTYYHGMDAAHITIPLVKGTDSKRLANNLAKIIGSDFRLDCGPRLEFKPWDTDEHLGPHIGVVVKADSSIQGSQREMEAKEVLHDVALLIVRGAIEHIDTDFMFCDAYCREFLRV